MHPSRVGHSGGCCTGRREVTQCPSPACRKPGAAGAAALPQPQEWTWPRSSPHGSYRSKQPARARGPSAPTPTRCEHFRSSSVALGDDRRRGRSRRRAPASVPPWPRSAARPRHPLPCTSATCACSSAGWPAKVSGKPEPDGPRRPAQGHQAGQAVLRGRGVCRTAQGVRGGDFQDRRDTAIMRILIDTGMRVSGLANLRYDPDKDAANDVFLTQRRLRIRLKGGDETWVPIGKKAASALDRYLRARARHPGSIFPVAVARPPGAQSRPHDRLRDPRHARPTRQAGRNPERAPAPLPAFLADKWLAAGGSTDDLMHITGWKRRHGAGVHRSPRHRPRPRRTCASQPRRSNLASLPLPDQEH